MSEPVTQNKDATEQKDTKDDVKDAKEETKETAETITDTTAAPAAQPAPPKGCKKANFEKDVVYLYQFSRTPTIPSVSPFCLKVETWLRLAGLKYEVSTTIDIFPGSESFAYFEKKIRRNCAAGGKIRRRMFVLLE